VTLWYDVSDLTSWTLPHLTGIQRTTVGILNGLMARGANLRLVRHDATLQRFLPITAADLPVAIQRHLPWAAAAGTSQPPTTIPTKAPAAPASLPARARRRRFFHRDTFLGTSPAAVELRQAFREFKAASRQFRKKLRRWSVVRFTESTPGPALTASRFGHATLPRTLPHANGGLGEFLPGDTLVSLGASWPISGHAESAAGLRRQGVHVVRMIYDLIPTIKPQWVDEPTVRQVTNWVRRVLTESDHVLTISDFSRREIEAFCAESRFGVPPLSVVRLGDELDSADDEHPPLPRFVPRRPFFVCVSTLDIRKNHRLLYDAWNVLAGRDAEACPDLVCLGVPHLYVADLLREIRQDRTVNGRIHFLHGVEDAELAWYYRHCVATIYPSRYEGWGLPVAESLGHGRLCLASNATSIPEISSDLPAFFDPFDVPGLVSLIDRTLRDPEWVRDREAAIRAGFVATPWNHTAGQVLAAVQAVTQAEGRSMQAA
jgi:glycosyltransferase involved in cell wall biosynthesis